jgi:ABC-type lipoprotein export system ATPase subunit
MVTHEPDMAAYAGRTIHFHDGLVHSDSNHHTHSAAGITPTESALAEAGRDA